MIDTRLSLVGIGTHVLVRIGILSLLCFLYLSRASGTKEPEVGNLVTSTNDPVVGAAFVELHTGHREIQHTAGTTLQLEGHVVMQGDIKA